MAGSTGVLPPPKGYLQRLRADLRQARHPADLRRGHHRLRPSRLRLRGRALRRRARHDHLRQGRHLGHRADGRRDRAQAHLRRLHEGPGARHRALPRLHLFGASARLRGRRSPRSTSTATRGLFERARELEPVWADAVHVAEGPAARRRHPHHRPRRRRSTSRRARTPSARAATRPWSAASTTRTSWSASPATPSRCRRR